MLFEETKFLNVKGKNISVQDFPKKVRDEITTYDEIRRRLVALKNDAKVLEAALVGQNLIIMKMVNSNDGESPDNRKEEDVITD